jgi:hypothetical protein
LIKEAVAEKVGIGVASVYRIAKAAKESLEQRAIRRHRFQTTAEDGSSILAVSKVKKNGDR